MIRRKNLKGMILAAGLGTRLMPLTLFRAKPAVPFLNRPLVLYSLELLRSLGIQETVINLHHLPTTVRSALKDYSTGIHFSYEEEILGTGGAIGKVRERLRGATVVVSNGKVYMEGEIGEALEFHFRTEALITMVLIPYTVKDPFNPVLMDNDNNIRAFTRTRPSKRDTGGGYSENGPLRPYVYTGLQILSPDVLDLIPEGRSESVNDIYPAVMKKGPLIKGFVTENYWLECSTPERYLANSLEVLRRNHLTCLASSSLSPTCSGVVVGDSVSVPENTRLENCIVWDGVSLARTSSYRNAIICSGVRDLPEKEHMEDVIITPSPGNDGYPARREVEIHPGFAVWPLKSGNS